MVERLARAVGQLLGQHGTLRKAFVAAQAAESACVYLPAALHLHRAPLVTRPSHLLLPAQMPHEAVGQNVSERRPLLVILFGARQEILHVVALSDWSRARPHSPHDLAVAIDGKDARFLWSATSPASDAVTEEDEEALAAAAAAAERFDWLDALRPAPDTLRRPSLQTVTRDLFTIWVTDYVALLFQGALALQLLRLSRRRGLARLRELFVASGRWSGAHFSVLRSAHARRMATAWYATAVLASPTVPPAVRLEWLDVERLLAALLPAADAPQRTTIELDEFLRASACTIAQALGSFARQGADGSGTHYERAPERDCVPVGGSGSKGLQQWSVPADFVVDYLRPHRHWERCKQLLLAVRPAEADLVASEQMMPLAVRALLLHPSQQLVPGLAVPLLEERARLLAPRPADWPAATLAHAFFATDAYAAERFIRGGSGGGDARAASPEVVAQVATRIGADIEDLASHLPPCLEAVRARGLQTHHLADDDRYRTAGIFKALGFRTEHGPQLVRLMEGSVQNSVFAQALAHRLGKNDGKSYAVGCASLRRDTVSGRIKSNSAIRCDYACPEACAAANAMPSQPIFRSPAAFVALHVGRGATS